jgi:TRAP-type C4-dicarboxylate transport system substrate-binding protein
VDYVGEKLGPMLEKRMLAKGYRVLFWTDTGWVRFFAKSPVLYPDDLKKLKLVVWAGATDEFDTWKAAGFSPVSLETKDITQGLFSGTVSAVCVPPVFALFSQLDAQAKHMLELNWGPLVGAAVVRKKSWDRLPADLQESLLKIATEAGTKVRAAGRAEADAAIAAMVKRGLTVTKVTPEAEAQWRVEVDKLESRIRGPIVPAEMYDEAQRLLKEYRAGAGAKAK